jgi:poly(A) polymerase
MEDLAKRILRTPVSANQSFDDDPLRMLRAARFAAQLGFSVEPLTAAAMWEMADRLKIVSSERIQAEFNKLLLAADPRSGLEILVESGLAEQFLPELPALQLELDEHHRHKDVYQHSLTVLEQAMALETEPPFPPSVEEHEAGLESMEGADDDAVPRPDSVLRLAALLHDAGKPATRRFEPGGQVSFHGHDVVGARIVKKRLRALKYEKKIVEQVGRLVELHLRFHGYGQSKWTDSAVRRYVADAGPLVGRLNRLTRADCTTRNKRKAETLWAACDELEHRITALKMQEKLDAVRPDLDGNQIMEILQIPPGRLVGQAYKYLLALRMESGPLERDEAVSALQAWYQQQL